MDELLSALLQSTRRIRNSCSPRSPPSASGVSEDARNVSAIPACGRPVADLLSRQANLVLRHHQSLAGDQITSPSLVITDRGPVDEALLRKRLADLLAIAEAKFMAFRFEILPSCWRELYTDVRILAFHLGVLASRLRRHGDRDGEASREVGELVKVLDMAVIVAGGGPGDGRAVINTLLGLLETAWNSHYSLGVPMEEEEVTDRRDAKRQKLNHGTPEEPPTMWEEGPSFSEDISFEPPVSRPAPRMSGLSMDGFQRYIDPATNPHDVIPVVFSDLMACWPALGERPWRKPAYLLSRTFGGRRYVPIEVGRSYVDEGWTQKLIPFGEFLSTYIDTSLTCAPGGPSANANANEPTETETKGPNCAAAPLRKGYLAQHDLFAQVPALRNDVLLPDYLWTEPPPHPAPAQNKPRVPAPQLNAWFGPAGTITPLHTDGMHNLLCQVVGRKYVRLYPPRCTPAMRPRGVEGGVDMGNTSGVDVGVVEGWDAGDDGLSGSEDEGPEGMGAAEERRRRFKEADYWDCVLGPGETVYIPIGWWHYVRSLSVSFSVSFWWN